MEQKSFSTSSGTIRYWINKDIPNAPTLVFLPGLTADHRLFERQIAYFEGRYNVLTWDAPGHGGSRPFQLDFSLMDKATWLHGILAAEGADKPILIGQSMGGYVSQCFMEKYPGEACGFISIDSAPIKRKYMTAMELWMLKRCEPMYRAYPWKTLLKSGSRGCATTPYGQQLMLDMMNSFERDEYCALAGHGFHILAEAVEAALPYRIDCPALLMCGTQDKAGSAKRYNVRWANEEKIPMVWIEGAGHNSNTDKPEEVNAAIEAFIAENKLA